MPNFWIKKQNNGTHILRWVIRINVAPNLSPADHRPGGLRTTETLFPVVLEVGRARNQHSVSGEGSHSGLWKAPSPCTLTWWKRWGSSLAFLYKGINPICEGSTLMTSSNSNYLLKSLPPETITLGMDGRVSTYDMLTITWQSGKSCSKD